ncbi:MAG: RNA 2',3'-cyclic phosphodiesterase [Terriglobia bacterium]
MRTFIAIDLPQAVKQAIGGLQSRLRSSLPLEAGRSADIRWTRPEGIHLTLKFLGEITEQQAALVAASLSSLPQFESFRVEVKGFGFFPNNHRARVLWVGVEAPCGLAALAAEVAAAMERLGFAKEDRAFTPHLTLARFVTPKPRPAIEMELQKIQGAALGAFEVSAYFLFESRLSAGAPSVYRKIAGFGRAEPLPAT